MQNLQDIAYEVDEIVDEEVTKRGLDSTLFNVRVYDCKTVGVQGDSRTYAYAVEIGYTGTVKIDDELWETLSNIIINGVPDVNRVARFLAERKED